VQAHWWWSKAETCRSDIYVYFTVNFNVLFKLIKVHLLLSELYITPRYFDVVYKWNAPSIQCNLTLCLTISITETYSLNLIFIHRKIAPQIYWHETTFHIFWKRNFFVNSGYIDYRPKRVLDVYLMFVIMFIHSVKCRGQDGTLSQPYLYFSGMDISPSTKTEYYLF
jgi:hypothetical protein